MEVREALDLMFVPSSYIRRLDDLHLEEGSFSKFATIGSLCALELVRLGLYFTSLHGIYDLYRAISQ